MLTTVHHDILQGNVAGQIGGKQNGIGYLPADGRFLPRAEYRA